MPEPLPVSDPTRTTDQPPVPDATRTFSGVPGVPAAVGRYRVLGVLGEGGMGVVLKAHDPELNRTVAIKLPLLAGSGTQAEARRQRFLREARAAAAIRHPNVCPIHDVGEADGRPFVVMAFVDGESLADRLARDPAGLSPAEAVRLVRAVAEGMAVVHAAGIIHRDLKPANVLIDRAGNPILTDFGLARVSDDEHVTTDGAVMGTPAYMAPEQAAGRTAEVGPATDVYGLGAVLYHLLAGHPPFRGATLSVLAKVQQDVPPALRELRPELDPQLVGVVERAMARRPADRYPHAGALAADLDGFGHGAPAQGGRRMYRRVVMVSIAVGLFVVGTWAAVRNRPSPTELPPPVSLGTHVGAPAPAGGTAAPAEPPLEAEFSVLVWSAARDGPKRGLPIQDASARPLRTDERVQFRARFNRPVYAYLAWLTPDAEVVLLHPWDRIRGDRALPNPVPFGGVGEVAAVLAVQVCPLPPPAGAPARELFSPADAESAWPLDDILGLETVVLMARSTPLPPGADIRKLLGRVDAEPGARTDEFYWLAFEPGATVARYTLPGFGAALRGPRLAPQAIDDPFLGLMKRLRPHFEHVEVVRFRHAP